MMYMFYSKSVSLVPYTAWVTVVCGFLPSVVSCRPWVTVVHGFLSSLTASLNASFSLQLQQQQTRLMKINHDLRHRVTVVEAQGKALIEQKVELEADLQTKEQEMGSLRAELGKLRERLQGEHSQNGEEEAEVSSKLV